MSVALLISDLEWTFIEENISISLDAWSNYYSRLFHTNKDLACSLVAVHVKFKILQFIFSLDRGSRPVHVINNLLDYLNTWISGKEND
jgi:cellobiose-specific phosphotransferase system component IIB